MVLGVDTGGTFTDFVLLDRGGLHAFKTLSTPDDPSRAILSGISALGIDDAVARGEVEVIHGSTVATNAALEGKGVRTAFVTNRGFTDMLRIGRQARRALYDLLPKAPPDPVPSELLLGTGGRMGHDGAELEPLTAGDLAELRRRVRELAPEAVAINLLHSYRDDRYERRIEEALEDLAYVARSSFVLPEYREYERGIATWLNASLGPIVARYLDQLVDELAPSRVSVMQSSGAVVAAARASRRAVNLLVSGPAGGLAAARFLGEAAGTPDLLTFDMGGTSTDVSLLRGSADLTDEGHVGPYPVAVPMADIHTIGAGGGSIAYLDAGGALQVGPESAGAAPGPACYGRGGVRPTVTDANLVLGRLPFDVPLASGLSLRVDAARAAIGSLAAALGRTVEATARGIADLANQHMAEALRMISLERGHDPRRFTLVCFGGAGGLHVTALAGMLQVPRILVPRLAGVFSAFGMLVADPGRQLVRTLNLPLEDSAATAIERQIEALAAGGREELEQDGIDSAAVSAAASVDLRYRGQSYTLNLPWDDVPRTRAAFHALHEHRYGHALDLPVELVNIRTDLRAPHLPVELPRLEPGTVAPEVRFTRVAELGDVPVLARSNFTVSTLFDGPAVILDEGATTFLDPGWSLRVDAWGHLHLRDEREGNGEKR